MKRIYIDVVTATWGDANDLVVRHVTQAEVDALDCASDSEIIHFAKTGNLS